MRLGLHIATSGASTQVLRLLLPLSTGTAIPIYSSQPALGDTWGRGRVAEGLHERCSLASAIESDRAMSGDYLTDEGCVR